MAKTLIALFYLNVLAKSYCYIPGLEGWSAHDQSLLADVRILKHASHPIEYITRPSEHQVEASQLFEAHQHNPVQEYSEDHQLNHERHEYQHIINHQHEQQEYEEIPEKHDHHHKKNVHYKFEYAVNDQKTGDVKSQREERQGDVVRGQYSVLEEDGNVRTVKYYADWKTGFHAQVHNSKPR